MSVPAYLEIAERKANQRALKTGVPRCKGIVPRKGIWLEHRCLMLGKYDGKCSSHNRKGPSKRKIAEAIILLESCGYKVI